MSLKEHLETLVQEANRRIREDVSLQKILEQYKGRSIILDIEDEASYRFDITVKGVRLETEKKPTLKPEDMYIKMDKERALRIISQKRLKLGDLPFIEHKNIRIRDVRLVRDLLEGNHSRTTQARKRKR